MIPSYHKFMRPVLELAKQSHGTELKHPDVIEPLADQFELSEDEREQMIPSGGKRYFDNRIG